MKQILVKEDIAEYISSIKSKDQCTAGVIVGTKSYEDKQILIRLSKAPMQDEKACFFLKELDHSWVAGHASQCTNYLPGGIDVIGIFIISPEATQKESQAFLKQVVSLFYKLELKFPIHQVNNTSEMNILAVHISNSNGNIVSCKQYNAADYKDSGTHIEWKYQAKVPCLNSIQTFFSLNINASVNVDPRNFQDNLFELLYENIKQDLKRFDKAHLEHSGNLKPNTDLFEKESHKKGGKGKPKSVIQKIYHCHLLLPSCDDMNDNVLNGHFKISNDLITCKGELLSVCYWPANVPVKELLLYLKDDITRTIRQRCELIYDDVTQGQTTIVFPKRILGQSDDGIVYSDYIFRDENLKECELRIKDALDVTTDAFDTKESHPSAIEEITVETVEKQEKLKDKPNKNLGNVMTAIVTICSATLVGGLAWLMSNIDL